MSVNWHEDWRWWLGPPLRVPKPGPPIFYRQPTRYDKGGWWWNYTTGSPQGPVDFSDTRWLHLLNDWVINGQQIHRRDAN